MRRVLATATTLFLLVSGNALAAWYEASSDHFVIYADESEKDIRRYSDRLERYYSAMSAIMTTRKPKPSPSNRVTNAHEIRASMEKWSRLVSEAIDVAKATKPPDPRAK